MGIHSFRRPEPATSPDTVSTVSGVFLPAAGIADSLVPDLRQAGRRERLPIEKAWVQFLEPYEWQWFATFTFKDETHPETACKRYRFWSRLLDDHNGVVDRKPKTDKRRCYWVRGLEWQKRGVIHFHALIGNLPWDCNSAISREDWSRAWLLMGNTGFAKIVPVAEIGGVSGYVTKYCAKGGEIDLSSNLPQPILDLSGSMTAA